MYNGSSRLYKPSRVVRAALLPQLHRGAKSNALSHLVYPLVLSLSAKIKSSALPNQQMANTSSAWVTPNPLVFFVCFLVSNVETGMVVSCYIRMPGPVLTTLMPAC